MPFKHFSEMVREETVIGHRLQQYWEDEVTSDLRASDLLGQLDEIEGRFDRYRIWRRRARRYLFIKLPVVGGLLYAASEFEMLSIVVPLMLAVGSVLYLAPWFRIRALERERDALLIRTAGSSGEGDIR
ncbi:MAG: hypothetical protein IIC36_14455 [Gemmatimonadetes bacterium]|nr:hypothetical protein [Gemmatimonadota bacterium]